jgi:hypothetical protein
LGIITCDRPAGRQKALTSLPWERLNRVVVVNDGAPVSSKILGEAGPQRCPNYSAPGLGKKSDKLYRNAKTNLQFDPK